MENHSPFETISFKTLGCKLNQSESDALCHQFQSKGFKIVPFGQPCDITVINTCTVTNMADRKSRAFIRQAVRISPKGRIVVTGCYAQIKPEDIAQIEGISLILGTSDKFKILEHLIKNKPQKSPLTFVQTEDLQEISYENQFISATTRTRAFLKIQEGCDYFCSYCIIPFARGRARSRSMESTLKEARELVAKGFQEIVLTGINIGTYEYDENRKFDLADLLESLEKIPGLKRLRLSSIEPNTVSIKLLKTFANSQVLCPHLHIPLQSGSDAILKAMNRKYVRADYEKLMEAFQKFLPNAALGTDVIVGFPGEESSHFKETLHFIGTQPFTYMHLFRYSDREGTAASKLLNPINPDVTKKRVQILNEIVGKKKRNYAKNFIGKTLPVLFDQNQKNSYSGYTPNYLRVQLESSEDLRNQIHWIKLLNQDANLFQGKWVRQAW